jgi:hypothetical protein
MVVVVFSGSFVRYGWCACFMVVETWIEFFLFHGLALVDSTVVVVHIEREGPVAEILGGYMFDSFVEEFGHGKWRMETGKRESLTSTATLCRITIVSEE